MDANPTPLRRESIASRHARLYDRTTPSTLSEKLVPFAVGIVIVGLIFGGLMFYSG